MKHFIKNLYIILILVFTACSDLTEDPVSVLAPEGFFTGPDDVEAALFGVYGRMTSDAAWGGELTQSLILMSDMVSVGNTGAASQNFELDQFNLAPDHYYSRVNWARAYDIINAANTAIIGARSINVDENLKLRLEAEARALRAFNYYTFTRLYGAMPYLEEPATSIEESLSLERMSESELYDKIIEDLEFAFVENRLPNVNDGGARTRVTRGTVATILASVHLTRENWQEAYNKAKWVMDNKGTFGYDLVTDYQDLFDATKQDGIAEHILAVDFLGGYRAADNDDTMSPLTGVGGVSGVSGGWSIVVPTMKVYDDWDNKDYRKGVALDTAVVNASGDIISYQDFPRAKRPHIAKYNRFLGNAGGSGRRSDYNYCLFRYAEVVLIAAEALNELQGPNAENLSYVNLVRARARNNPAGASNFPTDVSLGLTQDQLRDTIMNDRRLELSFEYKRWFDIKRKKLGDAAFKGPNSLEPQPLFDSSKHYLMPIPQTEIDVNPNISQNPFY
ncbi:RagB/SusD family nutrient uptake outer membrane protein [Wocania ichthyoenteri]|uniref:RagB/SusD family nutrient uptake outer membrane protein n=1 Tax=Wocania ichthyoenteri TaxID=1230531 RepID=UPI00053EE02A|nr:RagB/SusD family nutrient uptake outer membrane protein [Wocania ichthyoenteri]